MRGGSGAGCQGQSAERERLRHISAVVRPRVAGLGDGSGTAASGNARWIDTDVEFSDEEDGDELPIAPVIVGAGVAVRF